MNKQEAIDKIKNIGTLKINDTVLHQQFEMVDKNKVLDIISKIHEPKKVVVPKFVAYWYEKNKYDFESNLYKLFVDYYNCYLGIKMMTWFHDKHNNPIQTLTAMHQVGYKIKEEKEKLYQVELPGSHKHGDIILVKDDDGDITYDVVFSDKWKERDYTKLTESEIKQDFAWAWQFAKEVQE